MSSRPDSESAAEMQRRYYTESADRYDHMHAYEGAGDPSNLKYVTALFQGVGVQSVLEVGCATGRGLRSLQDALPDAFVCGLDPVGALLGRAASAAHHTRICLIQGVGESLPARSTTAVLHTLPWLASGWGFQDRRLSRG